MPGEFGTVFGLGLSSHAEELRYGRPSAEWVTCFQRVGGLDVEPLGDWCGCRGGVAGESHGGGGFARLLVPGVVAA